MSAISRRSEFLVKIVVQAAGPIRPRTGRAPISIVGVKLATGV